MIGQVVPFGYVGKGSFDAEGSGPVTPRNFRTKTFYYPRDSSLSGSSTVFFSITNSFSGRWK